MKAVFMTAGAAGMYCGSCMHDNALARGLRQLDVDCLLQPVYTPIRTDEESIAGDELLFGGIHIYLLQQMPWLRWVPLPLRRILDWKPLLQLATRRAASTDARQLGALAISMLRGVHGRQADEVNRLVDWLCDEIRPDAIVFSNLLIAGCLPELKARLPHSRRIVLLQGDDIFLDYLPVAIRAEAVKLLSELVPHVDRFVTHSQFYADKMGSLLSIPRPQIAITPLSIDPQPFEHPLSNASLSPLTKRSEHEFRLGYMARIAPEKGLHHLVDAFVELASPNRNGVASRHKELTLHVAGWLGEANRSYLDSLVRKIDQAGLSDRFVYHGSPSLEEKSALLHSFDLMSVPTDYQDPKGLFVLESLACGVPVIQPDHGAFPELIAATAGGLLFQPGEVRQLCESIRRLMHDDRLRQQLGQDGRQQVLANHTITQAAARMKQLCFDV